MKKMQSRYLYKISSRTQVGNAYLESIFKKKNIFVNYYLAKIIDLQVFLNKCKTLT
jgi:hypothetical protein